MPEMPEMQGLAERLAEAVTGKALAGYQPLQFAALKTFEPDPDVLVGRTVTEVDRRGKFVIVTFDDGYRLLFHLSQGGRVDVEEPAKTTRPKQGVVRLRFDDGPAILIKEFGTERKAGWWVLAPGDDGPLEKLGPDVTTDEFATWVRTTDDRRRVHTVLRDQRTVSGIGRGYTDDALHRARISPFATIGSLSTDDRERLLSSIRAVLDEGLTHERTRTGGLPTKLGDHWIVHHRHGEPCPACGDTLQRVSYESYEVTYCPACQTGGKVLADRRLSRLLK